jgi:hypothetical protein
MARAVASGERPGLDAPSTECGPHDGRSRDRAGSRDLGTAVVSAVEAARLVDIPRTCARPAMARPITQREHAAYLADGILAAMTLAELAAGPHATEPAAQPSVHVARIVFNEPRPSIRSRLTPQPHARMDAHTLRSSPPDATRGVAGTRRPHRRNGSRRPPSPVHAKSLRLKRLTDKVGRFQPQRDGRLLVSRRTFVLLPELLWTSRRDGAPLRRRAVCSPD